MSKNKKVILAFSGGLDTSFCTVWLRELGYEVMTVFVNTGGLTKQELKRIGERAEELGAIKHYTISGEKEIFDKIIVYLVKANGLYQEIYPQLCADRYVIVEKCIEITKKEKTNLIAHGCTAMGNDQVRFDVSIRTFGDYKIISPIREIQTEIKGNLREYEIEYLQNRGFKVPKRHKRYTINQNILGVTISGSEIDDNDEPSEEAFIITKKVSLNSPRYIQIGFRKGLPVTLNGHNTPGISMLDSLNRIVGSYGIGRFIYTGDCIIGIKGRIAFECPGLYALITAHKALEDAVLSKEQNQFKMFPNQKWSQLVYAGLYYDPLRKDIEKFIDSLQQYITGSVTLKLQQGSLLAVEYSSPYLVKEQGVVYAQQATWKPYEAEGFVKLFGLSTTLVAKHRK